LTNLKYLNISHTKCTNDILNLENLKELYIDNSNIIDLNFVLELPKLEILSLSEEQYKDKKELIEKIKNKNIEIYDYSIMLLGEIE
jgi:Leucine-rich repeat (LRR) protein